MSKEVRTSVCLIWMLIQDIESSQEGIKRVDPANDTVEVPETGWKEMYLINFSPIGTIHTPFKDLEGMPIQPTGAQGVSGTVELLPAYEEGLKNLAPSSIF